MQRALPFILLLLLSAASLIAKEQGHARKHINYYFAAITAEADGIRLTFKPEGERFQYQIGDSVTKVNAYSEQISLPYGTSLQLVGKHQKLTFQPASTDGKEYNVTEKIDHRSFGKTEFTRNIKLRILHHPERKVQFEYK